MSPSTTWTLPHVSMSLTDTYRQTVPTVLLYLIAKQTRIFLNKLFSMTGLTIWGCNNMHVGSVVMITWGKYLRDRIDELTHNLVHETLCLDQYFLVSEIVFRAGCNESWYVKSGPLQQHDYRGLQRETTDSWSRVAGSHKTTLLGMPNMPKLDHRPRFHLQDEEEHAL